MEAGKHVYFAIMTANEIPTDDLNRPLAGVRVLDMAHVLAGPSCSWLLGMMGADIIKVEKPHEGNLLRGVDSDPQRRANRMGHGYQSVNAGKPSIAVDFKAPEGRAIVLALADKADVLAEIGYASAAIERLAIQHIVSAPDTGSIKDRP